MIIVQSFTMKCKGGKNRQDTKVLNDDRYYVRNVSKFSVRMANPHETALRSSLFVRYESSMQDFRSTLFVQRLGTVNKCFNGNYGTRSARIVYCC